MKKLLAILLSMVLILGCFAACGNGDAAETIATTEEPEVFVTTQIIKGGASDYVIVHDGSTNAKDTATAVRNAISKEFGVSLDMVSNKEREESGCEIVVGEAREIARKTSWCFAQRISSPTSIWRCILPGRCFSIPSREI